MSDRYDKAFISKQADKVYKTLQGTFHFKRQP